jgi:hypothetical protein
MLQNGPSCQSKISSGSTNHPSPVSELAYVRYSHAIYFCVMADFIPCDAANPQSQKFPLHNLADVKLESVAVLGRDLQASPFCAQAP